MTVGLERHRNLAAALPIVTGRAVVDLGCGRGSTMLALRDRLGPRVQLIGVEREMPTLLESLAEDPQVSTVAADLNDRLPFADASIGAAVCHNALECLPDKQAFLAEVARVLVPEGHFLLGHTDFDTMVFNASEVELTRRLVHANADTQEAWMDAADGTIGRKLVAIARRSQLELVDAFAWVALHTDFDEGGAADAAVRSIAGAVRRAHDDELSSGFEEWAEDLRRLAERGEFLFSVNDYAVLLAKPDRSAPGLSATVGPSGQY